MHPQEATGWAGPPASEPFEHYLDEAMSIIERALNALEMHLRPLKRLGRRAATSHALPALRELQEELASSPTAQVTDTLPPDIRMAMLAVAHPVEVLLTNWKRMDHDARIEHLIRATSSTTVLRNSVELARAERLIKPLAM